jgi:hypothetical protein
MNLRDLPSLSSTTTPTAELGCVTGISLLVPEVGIEPRRDLRLSGF